MFGLYDKGGNFYIGNKPVVIIDDNIVVDDEEYESAPGLWELIVSRNSDDKCYVPTQLFLACTCVYLFLVSPVAIFRTGFPFVEYCSGSFRPCLQSDY